MKNVAYKVNTTNPNIPNGFITDHFETDQDIVEGYLVVDQTTFQALIQNNVELLRKHEVNAGVQDVTFGIPVHTRRPAEEAQPVSAEIMAERKKAIEQNLSDAKLFQEFLSWKKSQQDS